MHVLMIEDRPEDRELIARRLQSSFTDLQLTEVANERAFRQALEQGVFDLVLTDYALHWTDGLQVLRAVKARFPQVPVVMFTESGSEEIAVEGMHHGLSDYILKKHLERLPVAVQAGLESARRQRELDQVTQELRQSRDELEARVQERTAELAAANTALAQANAALQTEVQERERLAAEAQRRAAELDGVFAAMPDLVAVYDAQGRITRINPAGEQLTRYPSERYGRPVAERMALRRFEAGAERRPMAPEETPVGRALRGEPVQNELVAMVEGEGSEETVTWLLVSATPVHGPAGKVTGVVAISKDITAQKRAEVALSESESRFAEVFRISPMAITISDSATGRCLEVNDAWLSAFGFQREEVIGRTALQLGLLPAEERQRLVEDMLQTETDNAHEVAFTGKDGKKLVLLARMTPIEWGGCPCVMGVGIDITARKQAEEASREAMAEAQAGQRLLEAVLEYVPGGITISDAEGTLLRVSRFGKELLGDTFEGGATSAVTGGVIYRTDGITPLPYEEIPLIRALHSGEVVQDVEVVHLNAQGRPLSLLCNAAPIRDAEGQVVGGIVTWNDITERKQVEESLRESQEQRRSLVENLPSVLMRYDRQFQVVYLSPQSEAITGIPVEQFQGKTNREVGMPETLCAQWEEAIDQVFHTGENRDLEFDFSSPQGPRSFHLRLAPERAADGAIRHVLGISTDITERKQAEEALRESERHWRLLTVNSPDIVFYQDMDLVYRWIANPTPGLQVADVLGKTDEDLLPEDQAQRVIELKQRVLQTGKSAHGEMILSPGGEPRWYDAIYEPWRNDDGAIAGVAGYARDITKRRQAEECLAVAHAETVQERNRLAALMEALPVGVAIVNPQGSKVQANAAFEQLWGTPRPLVRDLDDYAAYQAWWADSGQPVQPEEWASIRAVRKGETVVGQEFQIQRFDGTLAWVLSSAAPIRDAEGLIIGSAVAIQDVTALKQVEQSLRESEERFRLALRGSDITVATLDADRRYTWVYNTRHGFSPEQTVGKRAEELLPLEEVAETVAQQKQVLETGVGERREVHRVTVGKEWFYDSLMEPLRDEFGQVTGFTYVAIDITRRKQAEQEREELLKQVQKDAATRATLLQEINHRVKNNLAAIVGLIYAQQDRPGVRDQPVYRAVLGDLERWVQGFSVVHGLLSAAQWAPLPLDGLVQAIVASCAKTVLPGKVAVQMQCAPLPISSELAQPLALVVNEVVTNMARHAFGERRAGQLIVTGRQEGAEVLLTLRDDGPGYPEEVLAEKQHGVGLELVRNLVRRNLRGRMVLRNEGGAVAEIRFPLIWAAPEK